MRRFGVNKNAVRTTNFIGQPANLVTVERCREEKLWKYVLWKLAHLPLLPFGGLPAKMKTT